MQGLAGVAGFAGWRWLFFLEGLPAVLVGLAVLRFLDDGPAEANWLTGQEKAELHAMLIREASKKPKLSTRRVLCDGRVWLLGAINFCFALGLYGVGFWLPQLLADAGARGALRIGLLSMISVRCGRSAHGVGRMALGYFRRAPSPDCPICSA